jgi:predicted nuclease of restriction endonuclease-like (RecB) superfamily
MTQHLGKSLRHNASQCPRPLRREMHNRARDLQTEFPGRNRFSAPNLWFMRQFYNEHCDKPKLQSLIGEISWAKNLLIMARCKDDVERKFYLRATARFGWTSKVLQHQFREFSKSALSEHIDNEKRSQ